MEPASSWAHWALAIAGSGLLHTLALLGVPESPTRPVVPDWRDSVMIEIPEPAPVPVPPPPPEQEPAPEPDPEPLQAPPPEPEVVRAEDLAPENVPEAPQPTEAAPADAPPPVQGLSAASFATDGSSGLTMRAGTTLSAASSAAPALDEPVARPEAIAWSDAPRPPKCRVPSVVVPESVIDAGLEGEVHVRFDIDATGAIDRVRVVRGLSTDADAACVNAWSHTQCKPARRGREPVAVVDMPHSCLFRSRS